MARLGLIARSGFGRVVPDPFVLAIGLSMIVLLAAIAYSGGGSITVHGALDTVQLWSSKGLWKLLVFGMQTCIMLTLGAALADAPVVRSLLSRVIAVPRSPRALVGTVACTAACLALVNWTFGLIGGALLAREAGRRILKEGWRLHYPLVCAAGYSSMMVWHCGLSGSAPLKSSKESDALEVLGPDLVERVGIIGLDRTMFSALNLVVALGLVLLTTLVFMALVPEDDPDAMLPPSSLLDEPPPLPQSTETPTWLDHLEASRGVLWVLAIPMAIGLALHYAQRGLGGLDVDTLNLTLWCLTMLVHGDPKQFQAAIERGITGCSGVLLQFPLYAGMMTLMAASGLCAAIAGIAIALGPDLLAPASFLVAGLLNIFIPSGGGQWAVQGPIVLEAALRLDVDPARLVMAVAYGDAWTNMLQPFWALPLLAITRVRARDIVGYCALYMVIGGIWFLAMLYLWP